MGKNNSYTSPRNRTYHPIPRTQRKIFFLLFILILIPYAEITVHSKSLKNKKAEFPVYRVVLDPGHGGITLPPKSKYGDRYDLISKKYLDKYKYGASYHGIEERRIVYALAVKTARLLRYCSGKGNFGKFKRILKKYTRHIPPRIILKTKIIRGRSITRTRAKRMRNPNGEFRFFDYPDSVTGKMLPGRISRTNAFKPHLVVSLHLSSSGAREYRGMNPVLLAPYKFMRRGLDNLRGKKKSRRFFTRSRYSSWFCPSHRRDPWFCFRDDLSQYFTSYPVTRRLRIKYKKFRGYRYNMVTWRYRDKPGWEKQAARHRRKSRYSSNYRDVRIKGKFWDREKSLFERYRRASGPEGFGGDNAYASYELIRYMIYALNIHGLQNKRQHPGRSYYSIWIMPLHVNAINAFFELGYLNRGRDRYILTKKLNILAEGLAVGIYSLFAGVKPKKRRYRYTPKGKKINFKKYTLSNKKSYFDTVVK